MAGREFPAKPWNGYDYPSVTLWGIRRGYSRWDQGPGSSGGPRAQLLDDWMAGLAGGGGISIYYAILCIEYV